MSEITNQQREAAYASATEEQLFLYGSPESGALLWQLATKHGLTDSAQYIPLAMLVGDVILEIEKQTNLPNLLTNKLAVTSEAAIKITGDIIDFLNNPSLQKAPEAAPGAAVSPTEPTDLTSEIAETEAALNAIPKMRTMVQDAHESTTRSSSQSDLLNKSNRWTPKK